MVQKKEVLHLKDCFFVVEQTWQVSLIRRYEKKFKNQHKKFEIVKYTQNPNVSVILKD